MNEKENAWVQEYIKKSQVWREKGTPFLVQATIVFMREKMALAEERVRKEAADFFLNMADEERVRFAVMKKSHEERAAEVVKLFNTTPL